MSANYERAKRNIDGLNDYIKQQDLGNIDEYREHITMLFNRYSGDPRIRFESVEVDKGFFKWWYISYLSVTTTLVNVFHLSVEDAYKKVHESWDKVFHHYVHVYCVENEEKMLKAFATKGYMQTHFVHSFFQTVAGHCIVNAYMNIYQLNVKECEELYNYCLNTHWTNALNGEMLRVIL